MLKEGGKLILDYYDGSLKQGKTLTTRLYWRFLDITDQISIGDSIEDLAVLSDCIGDSVAIL